MSLQAFLAGKSDDGRGDPGKRLFRVTGKLRGRDEIIHRQRRGKARRTAGRQGVIRSGHIVAQGLGAEAAEEMEPALRTRPRTFIGSSVQISRCSGAIRFAISNAISMLPSVRMIIPFRRRDAPAISFLGSSAS